MRSVGHPSQGLQVLVELVSTFFGCKKLLFTPLNQSPLHRLHTDSLESCNLVEKTPNMHVNAHIMNVNTQVATQKT